MLPTKYASTRNKERVRDEDTKLIKKEFIRRRQKLSYLGMPSGEMRDILAWRKYINRFTTVEIDDKQRRELVLNVIRNNLQDRVDILFGDIEEILLKGKDQYNNRLKFPYTIVFLDFFGSILYRGFRRVKAIKALITKQTGNSFLLLLTFNLRERRYCKNVIMGVLKKIQKELCSYYVYDEPTRKKVESIVSWYSSNTTSEVYRQKLFVPYFIKTTAEECNYKVHAYSPIFYRGYNNSPMIHFAFKLLPEFESPTKTISEQTIIDIINLNQKEASRGRVFVKKNQAPLLNILKSNLKV
ncbi:hypothetical protein ES705_08885 [subsurface metagenome]